MPVKKRIHISLFFIQIQLNIFYEFSHYLSHKTYFLLFFNRVKRTDTGKKFIFLYENILLGALYFKNTHYKSNDQMIHNNIWILMKKYQFLNCSMFNWIWYFSVLWEYTYQNQ